MIRKHNSQKAIGMTRTLHLSIDHLSPRTRLLLIVSAGSLRGAPPIEMDGDAVHFFPRAAWSTDREFLLGSAPDLCVVEAYAQGQGAERVVLDRHGARLPELPSYSTTEGEMNAPELAQWRHAFAPDDGVMMLSLKNAEEIAHGFPPGRPAH